MFKGNSVAKSCLKSESAPLRFSDFVIKKAERRQLLSSFSLC